MSPVCLWCTVRPSCRYALVGSCAPLPPAGTANWAWYGPALPPARRGYGYVASAPVVCGTPVVLVQVCRFLRAVLPRSPVRQTGRGTALPCPRRVGGTAMSPVRPSCAVRPSCRYRCVGSCAPSCPGRRYGKLGVVRPCPGSGA